MNPLSDKIITTALVALAAVVFATTAAAQPLSEYPFGYAEQHPLGGKSATLAADDLSQYGWGAAATYAKQHGGKSATLAADDLSQYGWGAAATYAKQHGAKSATLAADDLSQYGWGAAGTYAKQQAAATPSGRTITGGELMAMDKGYPTYHSGSEQSRIDALYDRSEAKSNEYYGVGSSDAVRPDDRATPRPVVTGSVATSASGDDTAWVDVTAGALGGFGIALLVGIGGFLLISRRRPTVAH